MQEVKVQAGKKMIACGHFFVGIV